MTILRGSSLTLILVSRTGEEVNCYYWHPSQGITNLDAQTPSLARIVLRGRSVQAEQVARVVQTAGYGARSESLGSYY